MIDQDFLEKLALKNQTTVPNLAREYFQHRFLNFFYQQKEANQVFFKGGTALKMAFGSPRFSEDLDFSSSLRSCRRVEKLVENTLVELEREGIKVEIREAKSTSGGCLFIFQSKIIVDLSLKLDVSLRKGRLEGERVLIKNPLSPAYTVVLLETKELVREKIRALEERRQARDFFDLYFVLRARIGLEVIVERKKELIALIEKEKNTFFQKELKTLLPRSYHGLLANFGQILTEELERV